MAEFGWAYVAGGAITGAAGPTGSIQIKANGTELAGHSDLLWDSANKVLQVTGGVSSSVNISASAFYGDGSNLTNVGGTISALNNQVANRLVSIGATTTELDGEANLTFDGTTLTLNGVLSGSGNISGSAFYGDGSNLTNVGSELIVKEEGSDITTAATSINFVGAFVTASNSGNDVTVTVNAGGGGSGGSIGAAEDGDYTDGLFTDFTTNTLIGVPIDRFNEVLKILAPSPAPALSRVNSDNTSGTTVKLSFGASSALSDYTSSNTAAGFSAVNQTGQYASATSGSNFRLGAYKNDTDITGFLNFHIVESVQNAYIAYSNDAFGNAETGSLKLELNGNIIHTVDLTGLAGAGNPFTGSANSLTGDSGFTNVSVTASSFDGNNSEWYIFKHRTAKIKVDVNDMVPGWNYVRAIHTVGGTDYATNFIEWVNDPSGSTNDLSVTNARIEDINLVGSKYLSGVQYNTDATANYKAEINNLYRNVYAASGNPISFTVSNSTTPSAQSVPDLSLGVENNTKVLGITASLDYNSNSLVSGAITCNTTVTHPFKSTISNQGSATTGNGFLIDNRSLSSTNTSEKFHDESFRKTSGSYDAQALVLGSSAVWNSQNHMTGGGASGHTDGLLMFNQRLYSPIDGDVPAGGNFSSLSNVASGQPNYSGVTGTRTFYRVVSNSSGADLYNMRITSTKNSTTYNNSTLSTANAHFFVKIPGATGWMDISQNFSYGSVTDGAGALINGASNDVDSGNNTHNITFGTASVANNNHIMIKILADESWQGYISQLDFTLPANQNQATPNALSDLEADSNTGNDAKLSFGSSNGIATYSNVQGSGVGSMSTINSNGAYTVSGNRRGVFSAAPTIQGELNEAIAADGGGDFPAKAFSNAYTGSLVLEINGSDQHTVDLTSSLGVINTTNGNGSRLNISEVGYSTESNIPNYIKPYRTGSYSIAASDQRSGWNYARIKHVIGDSTATTNYVEWVVDPSGSTDNTAVSTATLQNFGGEPDDYYYQSGIRYFTTDSVPTSSFRYTASNFYNNVYSNDSDAVSFPTTTNCSVTNTRITGSGITTFNSGVSSTSMPALNNTADCELTDIEVTGTIRYTGGTSIPTENSMFNQRTVSVEGRVKHVTGLKSNRDTNTVNSAQFFFYSGSIGSTTLTTDEYFGLETYRIVSGNYDNQAAITSSTNTWNSSTAMNNGGGHDDGMVTANGRVFSPLLIGDEGDTRSLIDSGMFQAPVGNPNYSNLTTDKRSYYRMFRYTGVSTVSSFTLTLYGDATLRSIGPGSDPYFAALGANKNVNVEFKVSYDPNFPGADDQSTGWADVAKIFDASNQPNNDGAGIRSGASSGEDVTIDSGGLALSLTLGTRRVKQNQYFIIKVTADEDWSGYISRIQVAL